MIVRSLAEQVAQAGWASTTTLVDATELDALSDALAPALEASAGRGGVRNLLTTSAEVRAVAASGPMREVADQVLGRDAGAVRALLFDKTPDTNWRVVWHQDLTIAVDAEHPDAAYGPWSRKDGVVHVQPPVSVLEDMLAVRLHLDPCASWNGPVRVLSGSHRGGRMSPAEIDRWRATTSEAICEAAAGALLVFRPLLLHASSPAERPGHRRVLHIEYGPRELPGGVRWHTWIPRAPRSR